MLNRNKTGELIVKPRYSSRTKILIAGIIAFLMVVAAGAIYNYGLTTAGFQRLVASRTQEGLQRQIEQFQDENQQLREALARAERTLQMDQAAYRDLDASLKDSARQIVKLREELNFYRNIISPPNKKSGLRIQSLHIEPGASEHQFKYKLVLIQALKHDHAVRGTASLVVSGTQAGKSAELTFPQAKVDAIKINFKYFQEIEGEFALPKDFEPREIKVSVNPYGQGADAVEEVYAWPALDGKV